MRRYFVLQPEAPPRWYSIVASSVGAALIVALTIAAIFGAWWWLHGVFAEPADAVKITVTNIPPGTEFLCLVADTPDGPQLMDWVRRGIISSAASDTGEDGEQTGKVHWISSDRVGVLRQMKGQTWFVSWYDSPRSEPSGRSWHADLVEANEVRPVSRDELRCMGFYLEIGEVP